MTDDHGVGWGTEGRGPSIVSPAGVPMALASELARLGLDFTGEQLPLSPSGPREWTFVSPRKVQLARLDSLLARAYRCVLQNSRADAPLYLRYWKIARGGRLCIVVGAPPSDSGDCTGKT